MNHRAARPHRNPHPPVNRREMLQRIGAGFGSLGLAGLLAAEPAHATQVGSPLAPRSSTTWSFGG